MNFLKKVEQITNFDENTKTFYHVSSRELTKDGLASKVFISELSKTEIEELLRVLNSLIA